jgi:stage II sporulation protein D
VSPTSPAPQPRDTVRIAPARGGSFLVVGSYPEVASRCRHVEQPRLKARYPGRLTVHRSADGTLSLSVTVTFDEYLEGIAEVPSSWPRAALEAQAVAARSYALATTGWSGEEGETLDEPICATTSCQVYRGIPVGRNGTVARWWGAVRRTDGQVLLVDGRPAETVYFSTSDGRTYGNDEVFGSSPLPYLRGVVERDDGASPTSHWQTTISFPELATFLAAGDLWPAGRRITEVHGDGARVTVRGSGRTRAIDGSAFREAVNVWAPCLRPDRYPSGALPTTIPSRWMTASSTRTAAVVTGRGWGHGAGMVQWGAYGKARRGWTADRILGFYYGGLHPEPFAEPGLIHVQIASGLTQLRVVTSRTGATIDGEDLARGRVVITGGSSLGVR